MTEEFENTVKPQKLSEDKFKREANEYLSVLEEYKKMDKMMKQYESNIKNYMVDNDVDTYANKHGRITIEHSKRNCLNRALINDISQYYQEISCVTMRKSLNINKPIKEQKISNVPVSRPKADTKTVHTESDSLTSTV